MNEVGELEIHCNTCTRNVVVWWCLTYASWKFSDKEHPQCMRLMLSLYDMWKRPLGHCGPIDKRLQTHSLRLEGGGSTWIWSLGGWRMTRSAGLLIDPSRNIIGSNLCCPGEMK